MIEADGSGGDAQSPGPPRTRSRLHGPVASLMLRMASGTVGTALSTSGTRCCTVGKSPKLTILESGGTRMGTAGGGVWPEQAGRDAYCRIGAPLPGEEVSDASVSVLVEDCEGRLNRHVVREAGSLVGELFPVFDLHVHRAGRI